MEHQGAPNSAEVRAVVLLQVDLVFMHRLVKNEKTLFTSGICKIAKLQNNRAQPVYFVNLNSFYYGIHPDSYFIKINYSDTVAYVFPHFENGMSSISLLANYESIPKFDQLLGQAARLIDYKTAIEIPNLRTLILENYPQLQKEQIYYPDTIKKVITKTGSFFGSAFEAVGGYVKSGVQKAGNYLNTKISEGQPAHIQDSTKQKWQKLKEGTNNFIHVSAEFAGKIINPVVSKAKEYSTQIQDKINRSNNQTVKYAKQLAQVSGKAIGSAFQGLVKGGTEVVSELGSQGKKIISKKYGEQVIKTFAGEQANKEPERRQEKPKQPNENEDRSEVRLHEVSSENIVYPNLEK